VGKGFRYKAISQNKINQMIVRFAKKGKRVVRLKGGDPYLFGRGGEEALHLVRHKIPFEVVPGVTSATACAAYAGIPLTHREHNASVTFLTGHRAEDDRLDSIHWDRIAKIGGTLVIYMGFYNLPKIATHLIRAGLSRKTPAAVIEWGTRPFQKTVQAPLENIAAKVRQEKLHAPCMIIIGDVVGLRKKLGWFEKLPLFGKKIVIARPADRVSVFSDQLKDLGADVWELPLIQIQKIINNPAMKEMIRRLSEYDWLLFASVYSVRFFFEALKLEGLDARCLSTAQVACVGTQTAQELKLHGIYPDLIPKDFGTKGLLEALKQRLGSFKKKRFFIPRSDIAPNSLEVFLRKEGGHCAAGNRVSKEARSRC
jgi:uroporphyrinogen III methyltransferase/synthase